MSHNDYEKHLGIPEEPEYTCPMIDNIQTTEKDIFKAVDILKRYVEDDDIMGGLDDISWYESDIRYESENVREANSQLREWGETWKVLCIELLDTYIPDWQRMKKDDIEDFMYENNNPKEIECEEHF